MKKLSSIAFVLLLIFSLTACEKSVSVKFDTKKPQQVEKKKNINLVLKEKKVDIKVSEKVEEIVKEKEEAGIEDKQEEKNVVQATDIVEEVLFAPFFSSITETEFNQKLKGKADMVVIDIRTPDEIIQGKITEDPLEIDYYKENFKDELEKLDKTKTYFIYCAHANRTGDAKKLMKNIGFTKVYDLKGGTITWKGKMYGQTPRSEVVQRFLGKPTVIVLAATSCPHCQTAMPAFEEGVWDNYNSKVNIFVNVLDNKKFPQKRIAQGYDATLTFRALTGEDCGYVPSWIILDKDGEVEKKTCGAGKGVDEITTTLDTLLK